MLLLFVIGASRMERSAYLREYQEEGYLWERLEFYVTGNGLGLRYFCFYNDEDDIWYLCLPSGIQQEELMLYGMPCEYITIDGEPYRAGDYLDKLWEKENSDIAFYDKNHVRLDGGRIRVMKSENIPSLHINTASGDMRYLNESRDNEETANLQVLTEKGELAAAVRLDYIKGRGNTSWYAAKKSFEMRLDQPLDLLGMEKTKTWILLANYYDITFIRNWIGMELGKAIGMEHTTDTQFVNLYLNSHYAGFYQVAEKVGRSPNGQDGFLLEFEHLPRITDQAYILLDNNQPIVVRGEKAVSEEELDQIRDFLAEMEMALNAEDYRNPETQKHIFDYIDKESFAQRYVLEEFLQNMDMGSTSHYMYLDTRDDSFILYAGPLWDLDNAFGRGIISNPSQFFADRFDLSKNNLSRWHARLYANEEFYHEVSTQYITKAKPYLEWLLSEGMGEWEAKMDAAMLMDQAQFGTDRGVFMMPDSGKAEHWKYLKDYIAGKMDILNDRWEDTPEALSLWREERLTELPPIEDKFDINEANPLIGGELRRSEEEVQLSGEGAGNDENQEDASGIRRAITWLLLYKRYWLLGCILLVLLLMMGKEVCPAVLRWFGRNKTQGGQEDE